MASGSFSNVDNHSATPTSVDFPKSIRSLGEQKPNVFLSTLSTSNPIAKWGQVTSISRTSPHILDNFREFLATFKRNNQFLLLNDPNLLKSFYLENQLQETLQVLEEVYREPYNNPKAGNKTTSNKGTIDIALLLKKLPCFQWEDHVWDDTRPVQPTASLCLLMFEKVIQDEEMDIKKVWTAFLPLCLSEKMNDWFIRTKKRLGSLSWGRFKVVFVDEHSVHPDDNKAEAMNNMMSLKYDTKAHVAKYVANFDTLKEHSGIQYLPLLKNYLMKGLPTELYSEAHKILLLNPESNKNWEGIFSAPILAGLKVYGSKNKDKPATPPTPQKIFCKYHKSGNHTTEDCKELSRIWREARKNGVSDKSKPCRHCGAIWNREHVCSVRHTHPNAKDKNQKRNLSQQKGHFKKKKK